MATIRYEITITNSNGTILSRFPSTAKSLANRIAKTRANELGGTASITEISPREYNPSEWE